MADYKVMVPDESYQLLNFVKDELPGVAVVNSGIKEFEPKIVFNWHLSLIMDLEDLVENGMPSKKEQEIVDNYGDLLDANLKGDTIKPNGLFLARITWNKTRQLVWRIYDPEIANNYLQQIISENSSPRQFDYRMEKDNDWLLAQWHLSH